MRFESCVLGNIVGTFKYDHSDSFLIGTFSSCMRCKTPVSLTSIRMAKNVDQTKHDGLNPGPNRKPKILVTLAGLNLVHCLCVRIPPPSVITTSNLQRTLHLGSLFKDAGAISPAFPVYWRHQFVDLLRQFLRHHMTVMTIPVEQCSTAHVGTSWTGCTP